MCKYYKPRHYECMSNMIDSLSLNWRDVETAITTPSGLFIKPSHVVCNSMQVCLSKYCEYLHRGGLAVMWTRLSKQEKHWVCKENCVTLHDIIANQRVVWTVTWLLSSLCDTMCHITGCKYGLDVGNRQQAQMCHSLRFWVQLTKWRRIAKMTSK